MPHLLTSQAAEKDFIQIWKYIADDRPINADHFLDFLYEQAFKLADTPQIGALHSELGIEIRIFPVKSYLLIYKPVPEGIILLRVLHSSMDYSKLF